MYNLNQLLNYPSGAYWWDGSVWKAIPTADWSTANEVSFCIPISNSRDGSTEIVLDKGGDSPLPVTLSAFYGSFIDGHSTINWATQSENSNIGWNIYRSENNSIVYSTQLNNDIIPGAGTTSEQTSYTYNDVYDLTENQTFYYWIYLMKILFIKEYFQQVWI